MLSFFVCFILGGIAYTWLELLWRGRSHVSMFAAGGIALSLLYSLFESYHMHILLKCTVGAVVITAVEFTAGCIVNLYMKLGVWDYSGKPLNLYGQICAEYFLLWWALSLPVAGLCSLLEALLPRI